MEKSKYIDSDGQELYIEPSNILNIDVDIFYNQKSEKHRIDGPAVIGSGIYLWYKEGKRHRIGGPSSYGKASDGLLTISIEISWCIDNKDVEVYYIYG